MRQNPPDTRERRPQGHAERIATKILALPVIIPTKITVALIRFGTKVAVRMAEDGVELRTDIDLSSSKKLKS